MQFCRAETPWSAIVPKFALRQPETVAGEPLRVLLVEDTQEAADMVRRYLSEQPEDPFHIGLRALPV